MIRRIALPLLAAVALATPPALPRVGFGAAINDDSTACVISVIDYETSEEKTRVILRANTPIDYRGGFLLGDQVILDLANVAVSLPGPVVEMGAPEVKRVIVGPEIRKDGDRVLKIRLTGVRARTHKVQAMGNSLVIDLASLDGAGRRRGFPKIINNDSEVIAGMTAAPGGGRFRPGEAGG